MATANAGPGARVIRAYVATYLERARHREEPGIFGRGEADALAVLLLTELLGRAGSDRASAAMRHDLLQLASTLIDARTMDASTNARAAACFRARAVAGAEIADEELRAAVRRGGQQEAVGSAVPIAWRYLLLCEADPEGSELGTRASYLSRRLPGLAEEIRGGSVSALGAGAQVSFLVLCSQRAPEAGLEEAIRDVVSALADALAGAGERALPSSRLAQVAAAARGRDNELAERARQVLAGRIHEERQLVRADATETEKFELSPWVPLAWGIDSIERGSLDDLFDPPAAPLPSFGIERIRTTNDALQVDLDVGGEAVRRVFTVQDFDLLVGRVLEMLERLDDEDQSPRTHAHMVIALRALADVTPAGPVADRLEKLIRRSLDHIIEKQEPNGGWSYSYSGKPSHVYSAGGVKTTEFPDRQYTIDAAVPGIALSLAAADGDERCLAAARSALRFFEETIGRVEWNGMRVWRLYPEDDKTIKQGTAVNYELWAAFFFAALARAIPGDEAVSRLRQYVDDCVGYAESHTRPTGDIAYGDYVQELRSAYASWDAYLLAEIAERTGSERAMDLSRRITRRLAEIMLPSGAIPNVTDYREQIDGIERWVVHRHGVGPYPIRADYQLYYVAAAALNGSAPEAALRALVFVLLEFFEPVFGGVGAGYYGGRGEFDERPGVFARDWVLLALAGLSRYSNVVYRADPSRPLSSEDRLRRALEALAPEDRGGVALWPQPEAMAHIEELVRSPVLQGDPDTAVALVSLLQGLTDRERGGQSIGVAREFLDRAARELFTETGRGRARSDGDELMTVDAACLFALAYVMIGRLLARRSYRKQGAKALRFALHWYRRPAGDLGAARETKADPATRARLAWALREILATDPEIGDSLAGTAPTRLAVLGDRTTPASAAPRSGACGAREAV